MSRGSGAQLLYRERKRKKGLCVYGGCHTPSKARYCPAHRDKQLLWGRKGKVGKLSTESLLRSRERALRRVKLIEAEIRNRGAGDLL
jgi:hypothetical protein